MLLAALRDLSWRKRRFLIAIVGAGLVFATGLIGSGLSESFRNELRRTVDGLGGDVFLVPLGTSGPFSARQPFPAAVTAQAEQVNGVEGAAPLLFTRSSVVLPSGKPIDVNIFGIIPGDLGAPLPSKGAPLSVSGEAVVDTASGIDVGQSFALGGRAFQVVGNTSKRTMFGNGPNLYIPLEDLQGILFGGQDVATSIIVKGSPTAPVPESVQVVTNAEAQADALRALRSAVSTIDILRILLWVVALTIVGSILYLSAIDRTRDIAVFKATGTSTGAIAAGMAVQALVVTVVASALAVVFSWILSPLFPVPVEIPRSAYLTLPAVAIGVGLVGSLGAVRRAVSIQPALAFGG
jgi:putative ABC transport system permease protein